MAFFVFVRLCCLELSRIVSESVAFGLVCWVRSAVAAAAVTNARVLCVVSMCICIQAWARNTRASHADQQRCACPYERIENEYARAYAKAEKASSPPPPPPPQTIDTHKDALQ